MWNQWLNNLTGRKLTILTESSLQNSKTIKTLLKNFMSKSNFEDLKFDCSRKPDYKLLFGNKEIGVLYRTIVGDRFYINFIGITSSFRKFEKEFLSRLEQIAKNEGCKYIISKDVFFKETSVLKQLRYDLYEKNRNGVKIYRKNIN